MPADDGAAMVQDSRRWLASSDVVAMFPSLVWKLQVEAGLRDALCANILSALAALRAGLPTLAPGKGWQSGQALHERAEFAELVGCIHRGAASVLKFLRIAEEQLEITGCWATVLAPGAAHKLHSHPNNFLSGVYYVQTRPGADTLSFTIRVRRPR